MISEALYCNIPIFVIPLPSFDQQYCAKFIKENGIGYSSNRITNENLIEFLNNIENYKRKAKTCANLTRPSNSLKYLCDEIEKYNLEEKK